MNGAVFLRVQPAVPCGRFAPSPTGPLHFGSLVSALGSCLDARQRGGRWLLRMEDLDGPRNQPGAADHILRTLDAFGFEWDGEVLWQHRRLDAYQAALDDLVAQGLAYPCTCSRREVAAASPRPSVDGAPLYPGTCRDRPRPQNFAPEPGRGVAWRARVAAGARNWMDLIQGPHAQDLARDVGDFVLYRADGIFAYQLAVVVDDGFQGVTHILRGADLLDSTPRQQWLQTALGLPLTGYGHFPVATNGAGEKLSKQTRAPALQTGRAAAQLQAALEFLGQDPPADLRGANLADTWAWARQHWSLARVPRVRAVCPPASVLAAVAGNADHEPHQAVTGPA